MILFSTPKTLYLGYYKEITYSRLNIKNKGLIKKLLDEKLVGVFFLPKSSISIG
jgi:hypothetical protein